MPAWARLFIVAVAVVTGYIASRAWGQHAMAKESRDAAQQAIARLVGPVEARAAVDLDHKPCFGNSYKRGAWSKFYADAYAACVQRKTLAALAARRPASPLRPASPSPTPAPSAANTGSVSSAGGLITLGNVRVLQFSRAPQLTVHLRFAASGDTRAVQGTALCSYTVQCQSRVLGAQNRRMVMGCPLEPVPGSTTEGELFFILPEAAPAAGACSVNLMLADRSAFRSAAVTVPLL